MTTQNNLDWHSVCKEIIESCVAPDMYPYAWAMLDKAMYKASKADEGSYRNFTANGYDWAFDEDGAHFYQKTSRNLDGSFLYKLMRCLPSDLTKDNFAYMAKHNLTNTNKAKAFVGEKNEP